MSAQDYQFEDHQKWLGYLQPEGLVVSPQVLVDSQVFINRNSAPLQQRFREYLDSRGQISDLLSLLTGFFGWPANSLLGTEKGGPIPEELKIPLKEYGELLEPTYALRERAGAGIILLIKESEGDLDERDRSDWGVSPSQRFERLLRDAQVPIGLLANRNALRLIYAPRGENSGSLTFQVTAMLEIAGRPIVAALDELLRGARLYSVPTETRLPSLLAKSREYQARVSEQLAQQVLEALFELVRGFQSADEKAKGSLLKAILEKNPNQIYEGLLNVLMRLVFILFAEDRALLPTSALYTENYSVHGLFSRLREDNQTYPDTMDSRYGAWPQLLTLFRAIYSGCEHPDLRMPAREGYLFDPERFTFLEGKTAPEETIPLLSDGTIFRVLEKLLLLDGERLSYRTLDVEHIGGVYETIMGFQMEQAAGLSISLKAAKAHGAPSAVNLEALLKLKPAERSKWLAENADTALAPVAAEGLKKAESIEDLLVALEKRIARGITPHPVPRGAMILQPSEERRRSGSHYTPRTLTEPIVRKALEPILKGLGANPKPEQILALKIADIAVGSGAFLVETCRQLAETLVGAWHYHDCTPQIPPDEDEVLFAKRAIAQKCLYGVDRNPMAVDLSKLSLWLATLAKDHPFTFLDHSIRCGDSLVGLTRRQIGRFSWSEGTGQLVLGQADLDKMIEAAAIERQKIIEASDSLSPHQKAEHLRKADAALGFARITGDFCVSAFFEAENERDRKNLREERSVEFSSAVQAARRGDLAALEGIRERVRSLGKEPVQAPLRPFHWEIEFPEVFANGHSGFDAIVGNPPFVGGRRVRETLGGEYFDWLPVLHAGSSGNADLVAHFFRRAFRLLRRDGCFGLIATNTISQGDTRHTGLRWICAKEGGTIYAARRRYKWPGIAVVVVSVVWIAKGSLPGPCDLDEKPVDRITAYLFHDGGHENPAVLAANFGKSFIGSYVLGIGFTFDDTDKKGVASPLAEMQRLIAKDRRNGERIFPYLGGEELNDSPTHAHHRFVINFADFPLRRDSLGGKSWIRAEDKQCAAWLQAGIVPLDYPEPVAADWPDLLQVIEEKVKPERTRKKADGSFALREPLPQRWWHFADKRPALTQALAKVSQALVVSQTSKYFSFALLPAAQVFSHKTVVFPSHSFSLFAILQSRVHEVWARFFGSSMKDDPVYTPSDCFETFAFAAGWETNASLESAGREYYQYRAPLMVRNNEGLTKTCNRFHDPDETSGEIANLRQLHAAVDSAVLKAYRWEDLIPQCKCEFILEYEEEEDGAGKPSKRKKPYRYRWPDDIRDEVLARLLKLNAERAEQERVLAMRGDVSKASAKRTTRPNDQRTLI
jgi:hypothetical protein